MVGGAPSPTPDDGHLTTGTTAGGADLTENELEDVVGGGSLIFGGFTSSSGSISGRSGGGPDTLFVGDSKTFRRTP